jgi:ferredoxin
VKVSIDSALCQGCGNCAMTVPDVFDVDAEGWGLVLVEHVPADREGDLRGAAANCPENAIVLA